jgi:lipopolysaccharide/colanic/teichoic acid biosynthesis glycosyltransferase
VTDVAPRPPARIVVPVGKESASPRRAYHACKRALDVAGSALLLLLLLPVLAVIAVLVKLDSPGPALYRQERLGSRPRPGAPGGWELRPFRILKFRSMRTDADPAVHQAHIASFVGGALAGAGEARFKIHEDERITRIGAFLRRTSLDELPQLVNVLLGEMSLVGPRPVPLYEASLYGPQHEARFLTRPGLTGLWQVSGRASRTFEEMMALDLEYVERQSLRLDLSILARTIPAAVRAKGAA